MFPLIFQLASSKGFSDFSGFKSTSCATFGRNSDDLALRVAAQTAVVCATFPIYVISDSVHVLHQICKSISNCSTALVHANAECELLSAVDRQQIQGRRRQLWRQRSRWPSMALDVLEGILSAAGMGGKTLLWKLLSSMTLVVSSRHPPPEVRFHAGHLWC